MKNNLYFNNLSNNLSSLENTQKNKIVKINFENLDYIENIFCEDQDVNYFLKEKTVQIYELQANSSLELGKILTEAFDKLSGNNHYDGLYERWLLNIGFNKMTALRHRKRYELYNEVLEEHSKKLIAVMPIRVLTELISTPEKDEILKAIEINKEIKTTDIKNLLVKKDEIYSIEDSNDETFIFKEIENLKKLNIKKLDIKKAKKLKDELEKILEDVKKILENI